MSLNWVMLDGTQDFVRLPREKVLITSPSRTALSLQTPNSYPGKEPLSIKCGDGKAIITTQRLIYLPAAPTSQLQSLSAPLLSLQDTHVTAPFFGPNVWEGILIPTAGGGFSPQHHVIQIKLTFKEGGAFDFHSTFERIKEQVAHAAEVARESGRANMNSSGPIDADLEQLPAYEEVGNAGRIPQPVSASAPQQGTQIQRPTPILPNGNERPAPQRDDQDNRPSKPEPANPASFAPPNEPPPGYEEVQARTVADNLEQSLRGEPNPRE